MIKNDLKSRTLRLLVSTILLLASVSVQSQNQVYWREGFEPDGTSPCDLKTVAPTVTGGAYFTGNAGSWYGFNVFRTTGPTGSCPTGASNHHVRYRNISGVTDSGYIVTPIVKFGIQEFHMLRGRASRRHTIWTTTDTLATTTNWVPVNYIYSLAGSGVCIDTMIRIASPTAKRIKITAAPGTDTDVDSIWLTSYSAIIPIELSSFTAHKVDKTAFLKWTTATEINNKLFEVQRSIDGSKYTTIGTVAAKGVPSTYNFTDEKPFTGTNYYRLNQVDLDGTETVTKVVSVTTTGNGTSKIKIFPSHTEGVITIENNGLTIDNITVYNNVGQLVLTNKGVNRLDLSALPSGIYLVQVKAGSETVTEKVFKR